MNRTINEKIAALRASMKAKGIDGYVIPSGDPHLSEYFSAHWAARAYFSGFTGSAGTLVVTAEMSGLWTDGRYFIQAAKQLEGSEITLFRIGEPGCPKIFDFLRDNLPNGGTAALNGLLFSETALSDARKVLAQNDIELRLDASVVDDNWPDRPEEKYTDIYELPDDIAGLSRTQKLEQLRALLKENDATATVISGLDSIAWLLNLRADDIPCSPVFISFLYVSVTAAALFTESSRLPKEIAEHLSAAGIEIHAYEALTDFVAAIPTEEKLFCDPAALNGAVFSAIRSNAMLSVVNGKDLITAMKACKNPTEIANQHKAYLYEGCAFAEFFSELFENLEKGETPTEFELCGRLSQLRREQKGCIGDSFGGIFAYRENAAIVHYSPAEVGSATVLPAHMLLVDSGGQFINGTTDTTRTVALGELTDEEKRDFTLVLKGHIAIATAVFPEGTTGKSIDTLCRANLWKYGLNYRHGTGHGVGYLLNVHDGPQSFSANVELKEGMVITNEPGFYKEGSHGIRTESVYYVAEHSVTEYGRFLCFKCFTVFPIDNNCVDFSLLTAEETEWLRNYNKTSVEKLLPHVSERAQNWLKRYVF